MSIHRREFLKLVSLTLTGLVLAPGQIVAQADDYLVNQQVGILIRRPRDWRFLSKKEFGSLGLPAEDMEAIVCALVKDDDSFKSMKKITPTIIVYGVETVFRHETLATFGKYNLTLRRNFSVYETLEGYEPIQRAAHNFNGLSGSETSGWYPFSLNSALPPSKIGLTTLQIVPNNFHYGIDLFFTHEIGDGADASYNWLRNNLVVA